MNKYLVIIIVFTLSIFSCTNEPSVNNPGLVESSSSTSDMETSRMKSELLQLANDRSNINIWHLNKERAIQYDNTWPQLQDPGQRITLMFKSSMDWLNAGDYEKSIQRLNSIFNYISDNKVNLDRQALNQAKELLGISYLRKAEVENCIRYHNAYSCIFPISQEGQHIVKDGATQARIIFEELLNSNPDNDQYKWLLNICHMTLGTYPDGVQKKYLVSPEVLRSDIKFPKFFDIASGLGVGINDISGSVVIDDFNNDYYYDILISSYGLNDQLYYYESDGESGLVDKTEDANLKGMFSGLNMVQADYNNDGYLDVLVLRGAWLGQYGTHPNSLLRNNGDGSFSDVTRSSGLYSLLPTQTATWADFNNDGWIDLFIANESSPRLQTQCQLFYNNQDGTFAEVGISKGVNVSAFIKGCTSSDYDNDGDVDIYLSLITGNNILFQNQGAQGDFIFKNVAQIAGVESPVKSFPCWFFDVNQDGWQDLFVSGFDFTQFQTAAGEVCKDFLGKPVTAEKPSLFINSQDGTFKEESESYDVNDVLFTMGCNYGDLNNDGFPDFYAATGTPDFRALIPNKMYLNQKSKFADVTTSGGFGHLQKGHGVAFADIDMDGDQDVYNVLGGSYDGDNFMNTLYDNPGVGDNDWVKLKLVGTNSNRAAIGAQVTTQVVDVNGQTRTYYNVVSSGGSFGANPLTIEQGLGKVERIVNVRVIWPGSQAVSNYKNLKPGILYLLKEDKQDAERIEAPPIKWNLSGHHHRH
ncbi:MAG: CRTAC1 family protein [Saprospiraceae bacterium]|nr:CRTAC1 family protein [Saprospiraceae bacterium]